MPGVAASLLGLTLGATAHLTTGSLTCRTLKAICRVVAGGADMAQT